MFHYSTGRATAEYADRYRLSTGGIRCLRLRRPCWTIRTGYPSWRHGESELRREFVPHCALTSCCLWHQRGHHGGVQCAIGATVFVFEVMLRRCKLPVLAAVAIATASAYLVNQAFFDHQFFAVDCPSTAYGGRDSGSTYGASMRVSSMVLHLQFAKTAAVERQNNA